MTSTTTPRPIYGDDLTRALDAWEDGRVNVLELCERLAVTHPNHLTRLDAVRQGHVEALLDTAEELGLTVEARRPRATSVVVAEDFVTTSTEFGYAAAWRTMRVHAGTYPITWVTLGGWPVREGERPYYALVTYNVTTLSEQYAGRVLTWTTQAYAYDALAGRTARLNVDRTPGAVFA